MCPTEANRAPQPARPRLGGRSAPAAGARLPDEAIPLAAALGAQPGGDPLPAAAPEQPYTGGHSPADAPLGSVSERPPAAAGSAGTRAGPPGPGAGRTGVGQFPRTPILLARRRSPTMPKSRPPYPAAFQQEMVELVRSGRTPGELAREFEPSAEAIRKTGSRRLIATLASAPTACAPKNMRRFVGCAGRTGGCAKNAKCWQKPRPGSRGRPDPGGLPVHEREPGSFSRRHDGPRARCLHERVTTRGVNVHPQLGAQADADLTARVRAIHADSRGNVRWRHGFTPNWPKPASRSAASVSHG